MVVQKGDVIVAGSDGLLDNLSELEMLDEVRARCAPDARGLGGVWGGCGWHFALAAGGLAGSRSLLVTIYTPPRPTTTPQSISPPNQQTNKPTNQQTNQQVNKGLRVNARASEIAQRLAKLAFEASIDRKRVTPYSRAATEAFDMVYSGGKKVRGLGVGGLGFGVWGWGLGLGFGGGWGLGSGVWGLGAAGECRRDPE